MLIQKPKNISIQSKIKTTPLPQRTLARLCYASKLTINLPEIELKDPVHLSCQETENRKNLREYLLLVRSAIKLANSKNKNNLGVGDNNNICSSNRNKAPLKNKSKIPIVRSDIQIFIDKETLLAFEDPDICTICFDNKLIGKNFTEFSCGHKFCNTCIIAHLTTNIINGRVTKN